MKHHSIEWNGLVRTGAAGKQRWTSRFNLSMWWLLGGATLLCAQRWLPLSKVAR
jgi:hypothetical protein